MSRCCIFRITSDLHIKVAQRYHHSAILSSILRRGRTARDLGYAQSDPRPVRYDEYFIMMHGDPTLIFRAGDKMMEFSMLYAKSRRMQSLRPRASDEKPAPPRGMDAQIPALTGLRCAPITASTPTPFSVRSRFLRSPVSEGGSRRITRWAFLQ